MKHKLLMLILALTLVIGLVSATGIAASADGTSTSVTTVNIAGVSPDADGNFDFSSLGDDEKIEGIATFSDGVLTLDNFSYESAGHSIIIEATGDLVIVLNGENKIINGHVNSGSPIETIKVEGKLTIEGSGTLHVENTGNTTYRYAMNTAITANSLHVECAELVAIAGESANPMYKGISWGIHAELTIGMTTKLIAKGYDAAWAHDDSNYVTYVNYLPNAEIKFGDDINACTDTHFVNASSKFDESPEKDSYVDSEADTYEYIEIVPAVFVTLYKNDIDLLSVTKWEYNVSIESPSHPTVDGCIFMGWYDSNSEIFNFPAPVVKSIVLYARFANYTKDINDLNNLGVKLEEEITKLSDALAKIDPEKISENTKHIAALKEELSNYKNYVENTYASTEKVVELEKALREADQKLAEADAAMNTAISALKDELAKLTSKVENDIQSAVSANASNIANNTEKLLALKNEIAGLAESLEGYVTDAELAVLQSNLEAADAAINDAISALKQEITNLRDDLNREVEALENSIADVKNDLAGVASNVATLEEKIDDINKTIAALDGKFATDEELAEAVEGLKNKIEEAEAENAKAITALKEEITNLRDDLNSKAEALQNAIDSKADAEEVNAKLDALEKALEKAQDSYDTIIRNDEIIIEKLDELQATLEEVQAQLDPNAIIEAVKQELLNKIADKTGVGIAKATEALKDAMNLLIKIKEKVVENEELRDRIENAIKQAKEDVVAYAEQKYEEIKAQIKAELEKQVTDVIMSNALVIELQTKLEKYITIIDNFDPDALKEEIKKEAINETVTLIDTLLNASAEELVVIQQQLQEQYDVDAEALARLIEKINKFNELQAQVEEFQTMLESYQARFEAAEKLAAELYLTVNGLEVTNPMTGATIVVKKGLVHKVADLEKKVSELEGELDAAVATLGTKADASEVTALATELATLTSTVKDLVEDLEKLDDIYATDAQLNSLKETLEDADVKLREAIDALTGRVDKIESELNKAVADLATKASVSEVTALATELATLTDTVKALVEKLEKLDETYATDAQLNSLKETLEEADVNLREAIDALTGRVDKIESELNKAVAELGGTKADVAEVAAKIAELQATVDALVTLKDKCLSAAEEVKEKLENTIKESKDEIERSIIALKDEVEKIKSELEDAMERLDNKADAAEVEENIAKLNEAIAALDSVKDAYAVADEELKSEIETIIKDSDKTILEAMEGLERRIKDLEKDNHMVETLAIVILGASTMLALGSVYFIFGNRFFPVDPRRSYQHVYIKDGVSKIRHTKSVK